MTVVFEAFSKKLTECEGKLFSTAFFLKLCSFIVAMYSFIVAISLPFMSSEG